MKKQLFWMIGAALALTSCSNDEQVAVNPVNEITFRTTVTRATEMKSDNLNNFNVTAYNIEEGKDPILHIKNDKYSKESSTFKGEVIHYWEPDVTAITGEAWSYGDDNSSIAPTTSDSSTYTYTVPVPDNEIKNQKDFITAHFLTNKEGYNSGEGIQLTFRHRFVKIQIKAKNSAVKDGKSYSIIVKQVEIGGIKTAETTATFEVKNGVGTWKNAEEEIKQFTSYTSTENSGIEIKNGEEAKSLLPDDGNCLMLLPQSSIEVWEPGGTTLIQGEANENNAYIALYAQIRHGDEDQTQIFPDDGTGYGWLAVPLPSSEWKMGYSYVYTLDFQQGGLGYTLAGKPVEGTEIIFTAQKLDWDQEVDSSTTNAQMKD